jgi:SAM-dependent methyltransferase
MHLRCCKPGMPWSSLIYRRVALQRAKQAYPLLQAVVADLEYLKFPPSTFDTILNFYYLQRNLIPEYQRWLKPGGVVIFETMTRDMLKIHPEINPDYLLHPENSVHYFIKIGKFSIIVKNGFPASTSASPRPSPVLRPGGFDVYR